MIFEILAAALFAIFALCFLLGKEYVNILFICALVLFPVAFFMSGKPIDSVTPHIIAGAVALIIGIGLMAKAGIGGGVAKGIAIIALWTPIEYLFNMAILAMMGGGIYTLVHIVARKFIPEIGDKLSYFAALMFGIASVVLYLQIS